MSGGPAPAATVAETAPAFLAARPRIVPSTDATPSSKRTVEASSTLWSYDSDTKPSPAPSAPLPPSSLAAPAVAMARRGPSYPGWENPPRLENFPRLRSREDRRANQPHLLAAVGMALVMVTLVLFPILMSPKGSSLGAGSPLPTVRFSSSPSASETIGPRTSFFQYKVQSGDQMWAIAATFNIALADLIAANPQIANPDRLFVGALLNIPPVGWHATKPPAAPSHK
jgi:nucleoid-associated protein YgaU